MTHKFSEIEPTKHVAVGLAAMGGSAMLGSKAVMTLVVMFNHSWNLDIVDFLVSPTLGSFNVYTQLIPTY